MLNQEPLVGVLGGVGPLATSRLLRRVIELTDASADQAHANLLVLDHAAIPDRTAYLLGSSAENPAPVLAADAALLDARGATRSSSPATPHTCFTTRFRPPFPSLWCI